MQMSEEARPTDSEAAQDEAAGIMGRRALTQEPGAENDDGPPDGDEKEEADRENSRRYRRTVRLPPATLMTQNPTELAAFVCKPRQLQSHVRSSPEILKR